MKKIDVWFKYTLHIKLQQQQSNQLQCQVPVPPIQLNPVVKS